MENYRSYGEIEGHIEKALSAMQDDLELTCAEVARQFFVPYPHLYARLKQRDSKITWPRTNLRLTEESPPRVRPSLWRVKFTALFPQLLDAAERILKQSEPEAAPLGKNWITHYLWRNPHLRWVRQKLQELERVAANEIPVYKKHFREFKAIVNEKGIQNGDIYNMDETGFRMDETVFRIGVGRNQWVITMDWKRPQISPSDTNRDYITSVEAVSVDGEVCLCWLYKEWIIYTSGMLIPACQIIILSTRLNLAIQTTRYQLIGYIILIIGAVSVSRVHGDFLFLTVMNRILRKNLLNIVMIKK